MEKGQSLVWQGHGAAFQEKSFVAAGESAGKPAGANTGSFNFTFYFQISL